MRFEHDAQEAAYKRVGEYIGQLYGEDAEAASDSPSFVLMRGSARIDVTVAAVGDQAVVAVYATVVSGVEPSQELYEYLLKHNAGSVFGAFGLVDGDVLFQYAMLGETIEKLELGTTVTAVVDTADEQDEEITRRFGGKRARDLDAG